MSRPLIASAILCAGFAVGTYLVIRHQELQVKQREQAMDEGWLEPQAT